MKEKLIEFFGKVNKRYLLIGLLALIIFVGLSVTRCVQVHTPIEAETEQSETAQAEQDPHTDAQKAQIEAYTDDVKNFLTLLEANAWTAHSDTVSLTFENNTFTEADGSSTNTVPFAVAAYKQTTETEVSLDDTTNIVVHTAAILMPDGTTKFLTLRQFAESAAGIPEDWSITSDAFSKNDSYMRTETAGNLTVSGLNSEVNELIGGKSEELTAQMQDFCALNYPSATTAVWSNMAAVDYSSNTVVMRFTLDNEAQSAINAVYSLAAGTFSISAV